MTSKRERKLWIKYLNSVYNNGMKAENMLNEEIIKAWKQYATGSRKKAK